jgi:tetratricopeptide (TPR) repeat protein
MHRPLVLLKRAAVWCARYFLAGNVRRTGANLRVSAQLIEAASQAIVWSQKFERPVSEQAAWLGATGFNLEMDRALRKPTDLTAWECVARAMAASREYGAEALLRAISKSQRAVEIAPDYGLARAMLTQQVSGGCLSFSLADPVKEREIQVHLDRAFALDPGNAAVLAAIGSASAYTGRRGEGLPRARKAIRLRRGHGLAHYAAGICALLQGLAEQGIGHMEDFLQIEPESHLYYITHVSRGIARARRREFCAARGNFAESLTLYPGNFIAKLLLTAIDWREGAGAAAVGHLAETLELEPQAGRALLHAQLDRFFAGSDERLARRAALDAAWDQSDERG